MVNDSVTAKMDLVGCVCISGVCACRCVCVKECAGMLMCVCVNCECVCAQLGVSASETEWSQSFGSKGVFLGSFMVSQVSRI